MRANVKPLTHWVIYKKYTVRFQTRGPQRVTGVLKTPAGEIQFQYEPQAMCIQLPDKQIVINEHGLEMETICKTPSS